ncbi:helix-turn-helix domain-containing protein [Tahibacter sp.]|uniref:helix-turn-helix domain-containing protein n=1 Tax=Tahibacter sp. TaxID=2056211 RepID=UPI0028C4C5FB|nr:helix-turn-helix domain-containing protein [Tahibacter sp.]
MAQPRKPRPATANRAVEKPRQIALLAAPARQELVDTLEALGGEASVATLAAQLGRPADGLYYHLRLLVGGGLLEELPDEGEGRRYRTRVDKGSRLQLRYRGGRNAGAAAVDKVGASMMRIAARDFSAALKRSDVATEGAEREVWASRSKGWVDRRDLAEINRLLTRALELLHKPRSATRDKLIALAWILAPLPVRPSRRGQADD